MGNGITPNDEVKPWWNVWQRSVERNNEIKEQLVRKNFDLPEPEDMELNRTEYHGIGARGLIGAILAAAIPGLGAAGLLAYVLSKTPDVTAQPAPVPDADTRYDIDGRDGGVW